MAEEEDRVKQGTNQTLIIHYHRDSYGMPRLSRLSELSVSHRSAKLEQIDATISTFPAISLNIEEYQSCASRYGMCNGNRYC